MLKIGYSNNEENIAQYYKNVCEICVKSVKVEPGCISCGSCQFIVPEVFEVTDTSHVKDTVDIQQYKERIQKAAAKCPVQVIRIEE